MKSRDWIIVVASLLTFASGNPLPAQPTPMPLVGLTIDAGTGGQDPAGIPTIGFGLSARVFDAKTLLVHLKGSMAFPAYTLESVCLERPCDTRSLRRERRIGIDMRRSLDTTALFAHIGLGASWSRVTGYVSPSPTWNGGSRERSFGFGRLGIGRRSQRAKRTRWIEAGLEQQAGAPHVTVFVQAGFGIL